jgi:hypothetical protein
VVLAETETRPQSDLIFEHYWRLHFSSRCSERYPLSLLVDEYPVAVQGNAKLYESLGVSRVKSARVEPRMGCFGALCTHVIENLVVSSGQSFLWAEVVFVLGSWESFGNLKE